MQTVIETKSYLAAADNAGMSEDERRRVVDMIALNPMAGELMPGTGGCRKVRFARSGKGKSGGYRIITYYGGHEVPIFLLTVFAKGERANLSHAERNGLKQLSAVLVHSLTKKVVAINR